MRKILIVSNDTDCRSSYAAMISASGYEPVFASPEEGLSDRLDSEQVSAVLLHQAVLSPWSPGPLREILAGGHRIPVIMVADDPPRDFVVAALKEGVHGFLGNPVDLELSREIIKRAVEKYALEQEVRELRQKAVAQEAAHDIICLSPAMNHAMNLARKVSATDVTVLITGDSGVGKELFARAITSMSERREGPFVSINCAAIPETLLEAELFGYEKGSFTGAERQHPGKFERASGGTIFLDEIGELSLSLQGKLLRVLQEKEIERLGSTKPIKIDIRLISATNRNLDSEVGQRRFREDLLYRVRVFEIRVPPLRERKEDIPLLAEHFLKRYAGEIGKDIQGIDKLALKFFLTYAWPGNVREMENLIQRAIILEDGRVLRGEAILGLMAAQKISRPLDSRSAKERVLLAKEQEEKKLIMEALIRSHWKRQEAAAILGISRKSLYNKIKKYGI